MAAAGRQPDRPGAEDRRSALVHAAHNRIARQGFEGLRTREVAADAGVNVTAPHHYVPGLVVRLPYRWWRGVADWTADSRAVAAGRSGAGPG